ARSTGRTTRRRALSTAGLTLVLSSWHRPATHTLFGEHSPVVRHIRGRGAQPRKRSAAADASTKAVRAPASSIGPRTAPSLAWRAMTAAGASAALETATPLLRVRDLVTSFRTERGVLRAVDEVSFDVPQG